MEENLKEHIHNLNTALQSMEDNEQESVALFSKLTAYKITVKAPNGNSCIVEMRPKDKEGFYLSLLKVEDNKGKEITSEAILLGEEEIEKDLRVVIKTGLELAECYE